MRPRDRLGRVEPHNPLRGAVGVVNLARMVPGFWGLWEKRVPEGFVERLGVGAAVACVCGERVVVPEGFVECGCGRWFLWAGGLDVRVKRFEVRDGE